jgi:hypothetical protein
MALSSFVTRVSDDLIQRSLCWREACRFKLSWNRWAWPIWTGLLALCRSPRTTAYTTPHQYRRRYPLGDWRANAHEPYGGPHNR